MSSQKMSQSALDSILDSALDEFEEQEAAEAAKQKLEDGLPEGETLKQLKHALWCRLHIQLRVHSVYSGLITVFIKWWECCR